MFRILGIDHGTARIGLALSDELAMVAHPLKTLDAGPDAEEEIARIVEQKRVREVALGMPLRMSGTRGEAALRVERFAERLRRLLPHGVAIVFVDERLSSRAARESLGFKERPRDHAQKKLVDQVAAAAILQDHLNSRQGPGAWLLPEEE